VTFATINTVGANVVSYSDMTVAATTTYWYQIVAANGTGSSLPSNIATVTTPGAAAPPAAPTNLAAVLYNAPLRVRLAFRDNAGTETGFVIERADNGGPFVQIAAPGPFAGTGTLTYVDSTVVLGNSYAYRVKAVNSGGSSAYSNTASISTLPPAAPSNVSVVAVVSGTSDLVTLTWTDNSNNESRFRIQRATNATFTTGLSSFTVGANATTYQQTRPFNTTWYYRVRAENTITGNSAWANASPFPIITP
jgi:hypothetical protein